jgi:hypothetical protein
MGMKHSSILLPGKVILDSSQTFDNEVESHCKDA